MIREFEGKTEKEAIEKAVAELGLSVEEFDVEILQTTVKKGLFFKRNMVRIAVHPLNVEKIQIEKSKPIKTKSTEPITPESMDTQELQAINFITGLLKYFGENNNVILRERLEGKFVLEISSSDPSVIIGKQGRNLDALQLLTNVFLHGKEDDAQRVDLDIENYRERREESITKGAIRAAASVVKTRSSRLLEPMNPFERRIVHSALSDYTGVETISEGEGLYKQVRVVLKKNR